MKMQGVRYKSIPVQAYLGRNISTSPRLFENSLAKISEKAYDYLSTDYTAGNCNGGLRSDSANPGNEPSDKNVLSEKKNYPLV
jgi:hypothetical protein